MCRDVKLTLIGGPTLLIELDGLRLITDPTFDPPGSYPSGTVTLEKLRGPALSVTDVGRIDAVLLSHDQHWDNLDRSGRAFLDGKTVFTTPAGAARLGQGAVALAPWQRTELANRLAVTATPARHGPRGIEPISGEVAGFLVGTAAEPGLIYVAGDTVWFEGTREIADRFQPRLAILFTGAAQPRGSFHMTMGANDAIEAAHAFAGARIVAVHNDGWRHFKESQADLRQAFATVGLAERLVPLEPGTPVTLQI